MYIYLPKEATQEQVEGIKRKIEAQCVGGVEWIGINTDYGHSGIRIESDPDLADSASKAFDIAYEMINFPVLPSAASQPPPDYPNKGAHENALAWHDKARDYGLEFVVKENEVALRPKYATWQPAHGFTSYARAWAVIGPVLGGHSVVPKYDHSQPPRGYDVEKSCQDGWFWRNKKITRIGYPTREDAMASAWAHSCRRQRNVDDLLVTVTLSKRQLELLDCLVMHGQQKVRDFVASEEFDQSGYDDLELEYFLWISENNLGDSLLSYLNYSPQNQKYNAFESACRTLVLAYSLADPDNGGGESVSWRDLDRAHERALKGMSESDIEKLGLLAKHFNEC